MSRRLMARFFNSRAPIFEQIVRIRLHFDLVGLKKSHHWCERLSGDTTGQVDPPTTRLEIFKLVCVVTPPAADRSAAGQSIGEALRDGEERVCW